MSTPAAFTPAPVKETVSRADFDKLDIRVGTIARVEDVPKSEKLIKLTVDFGDHARCILVGIGSRAG
jgi:tRNA-binding protein